MRASDLREMGLTQEQIDQLSEDRPVSSEEDQRQDGFQTQNGERKDDQRHEEQENAERASPGTHERRAPYHQGRALDHCRKYCVIYR